MAKAVADIRSLARAHTDMCILTLAKIASAPKAPESARVTASIALLDRGWGKPAATITGADGGPLTVIIRQLIDITQEDDTKLIEHDDAATG